MSLTVQLQANTATADASAGEDQFVLTWCGIKNSFFDGYEQRTDANGRSATDVWTQFTANTTDWPNQISWGTPKRHSWISVSTPYKVYKFYYRWTGQYPSQWPNFGHTDQFTVNFAPLCEDMEVAPETFMRWLEKLGHDEAFCNVSHRMQKRMMKHTKQKPPWDPRELQHFEDECAKLRRWAENLPRTEEDVKEEIKERWGVDEVPSITPELLDRITEKSRAFLEECLSPEELKFYDENGHIKVRSRAHSNIFYIVKIQPHGPIERWVNEKHEEDICFQSRWGGMPLFDTVAMKVLHIKNNEDKFLEIGNRYQWHIRQAA